MVMNALAAAAVGHAADLPVTAIVRGLQTFRPVRGRLVTSTTATGVTVIDDTYNANPDSVRAAIDVLATRAAPRWLALGDMGEVGDEGPRYHQEIGAYARTAGLDRIFASGELTRHAVTAFGEGAAHFAGVDDLAREVAAQAPSGATVLVKGSRFMRMERVVAALTGTASGGVH
jgi:UDP-N-acetylmuramoyl-tripeptide--D-alanyl-D-alanine ligase